MANLSLVSSSLHLRLPTMGAWLLSCGLAACSADVNVGQAKPAVIGSGGGDAATNGSSGMPSVVVAPTQPAPTEPAPTAPDCSATFAGQQKPYLDWQALTNDFGSLAGSVFTGTIDGGAELTLTIGAQQDASLVVGEVAPPPQAGDGYLCGGPHPVSQVTLNFCTPPSTTLLTGATYPIRGATFDGDRLQLPVQVFSPYDAWCAQQRPVLQSECFFNLFGLESVTWGEGGCVLGTRRVDCGWLELVFEISPCTCTPDTCAASVSLSTKIDLHYAAADGKLEGSVVFGNGESRRLQLVRVDD